jgi:type VI secretion system secreted protein Hcp
MADTDFFLKIEGIDGESIDSKLSKQLQIQSWSWGESNSGSSGIGGGAGSGKVSMQDFHFVVQYGKASPKLALACATGEHIASAMLTCRKPTGKGGQDKYLEIKFTDIVISSYQTGAGGGSGVLPMDQISFNYTKIEMEYFEQGKDGILKQAGKMSYDTKTNKGAA